MEICFDVEKAAAPPVVQVTRPTVKVRPGGMTMEAGRVTILSIWEAVRTPPTWRATVDET